MNPRLRIVLSFIVAIIVVGSIGGLIWYFFTRPHATAPVAATSTPSTSGKIPIAAFPKKALNVIEHAAYYDIDMQYPDSTPLLARAGASADAAAVEAMKIFTRNTIASFKESGNFANLTPEAIKAQGLDNGQKYTLSDEYQTYSGANTVSYVFTVTEDTLGAHPNSFFRTFVFDVKTGQELALSDLFAPNVNYLDAVSSAARAALTQQGKTNGNGSDFINPGTTPDADNFQSFAIDGTSLVIFFPPYQVAPYSLGPQTVRIPLSQLLDLLKSTYRASATQ